MTHEINEENNKFLELAYERLVKRIGELHGRLNVVETENEILRQMVNEQNSEVDSEKTKGE